MRCCMVRLETTEQRRRNMARIRSRDTGPELAFRKALREAGLTGYRKNLKGLPGTPDVAFIEIWTNLHGVDV